MMRIDDEQHAGTVHSSMSEEGLGDVRGDVAREHQVRGAGRTDGGRRGSSERVAGTSRGVDARSVEGTSLPRGPSDGAQRHSGSGRVAVHAVARGSCSDSSRVAGIVSRNGRTVKVEECPFCGRTHTHGRGEGPRLSHCLEDRDTYIVEEVFTDE